MRRCIALVALLILAAAPARAAPDDLAVIIVNQDYGAQAPAVKYALRDGGAFAKAAVDVLGVPDGRVKTYTNRTTGQLRRLLAPEGEIAGLMRGRPKGRIFLFYSGHGVPIDGAGYLLPVDVPPEAAKGDALAIAKLRESLLQMIGAEGQVVMFLDACFSGRSGDGGTMVRGASAGGPFDVAKSLAREKRAAVVAAARGDQVAWWDEPLAGGKARGREHGVFTDTLVDALYAAARSGTKELSLAELQDTLARRMADRLGSLFPGMGRTQTPDVSAEPAFAISGLSSGGRGRDPELTRREATRCLTLVAEDDAAEISAFLADCRTCQESGCHATLTKRLAEIQGAAEACRVERAEVKRLAARGAAARGPLAVLAKSAECLAARAEAAAALARLDVEEKSAIGQPKVSPQASPQWVSAEVLDLMREASAGNANAAYKVGIAMEHGKGAERNPAAAAKYYQMAADKHHHLAMHELARAHANGLGIPINHIEAARWYLAAIEVGSSFTLAQLKTNWAAYPVQSRIAIQERLKSSGQFRGAANGQFGTDTLAALDAIAAIRSRTILSDPAGLIAPGSGQSFKDRLANGGECAFCPELVVVPAGSFVMGSPASEQGRDDNEGPQRTVTLRQPFAVGKFEVTFDEWDACVSAGGCTHRPGDRQRGRRAVIYVAWEDAKQYVAWLSQVTGRGYRLLTEAEWEYAARATSRSRYHFGDSESQLGQYAWSIANSSTWPQPVGQKRPNGWGLHDMHGNVWEWVEDCWHDSYVGAPVDGSAWTTGCTETARVRRGGASGDAPQHLRSAVRLGLHPAIRSASSNNGLRVARTIGGPAEGSNTGGAPAGCAAGDAECHRQEALRALRRLP